MESINAMTLLYFILSKVNPKYSWSYRCLSAKVGAFKEVRIH